MKKIQIYIDGKTYKAEEGERVLDVALRNGIEIPHFCYHEDLPVGASCRTCLIEIENGKIETSCTVKATEGLKIKTNSKKIDRLRRENMELLLAGHKEHCPKCQKGLFCATAEIMNKYKVTGTKYQRDWTNRPIHALATAAGRIASAVYIQR
jgi:NADH-quinone oxidoreductase subunit G